MSMIYILIPISILLLFLAMLFFRWAVVSRQYDDLDSPADQILFDDREERQKSAPDSLE